MLIIGSTIMPRPKCNRKVCGKPGSDYFKPRGIPLFILEEVVLTPDELEAIRLGDLEGMYQERAAESMGISRQTFGRIIDSAHRKVAEALIKGKALRIEGGTALATGPRKFTCLSCSHTWGIVPGSGRPSGCPSCKSRSIERSDDEQDNGKTEKSGRRKACLTRKNT
jgi:predicted DNA-binding protein (UPF0251 family)